MDQLINKILSTMPGTTAVSYKQVLYNYNTPKLILEMNIL